MVGTNYSGSGFIGNKDISSKVAVELGNKIAHYKESNGGKLDEKAVHDLIRTASEDDGAVSQQEMDWINDSLSSQGNIITKLNINKSDFTKSSQFNFTIAKKDGSGATDFSSETLQGSAGKQIGKAHKKMESSQMSGSTSTIEAKKLSSLEKITQKMSQSNVSLNKCGASCVVSGSIYSKGRDGMVKLSEILDKKIKSIGMDLLPEHRDLIAKLKDSGKPLTKDDVSKLQDMTYYVLHNVQDKKWAESTGSQGSPGGLHTTIMRDFLNSPEMKELLGDNLKIKNIDFSGDGQADHFVLFINDKSKNPAVYDPWPRNDGKQVVSDKSQVQTYRDSVSDS